MSESMARRVRNLEADKWRLENDLSAARKRVYALESAVERLLDYVERASDGDGPLPEAYVLAERILRNGN